MTDKIAKFIESLNQKIRERLKKKMREIKEQPYSGNNIKKMKGWGENTYRVRMGKIRIVYRVKQGNIEIIDIDYRGSIY